MYFSKIVTVITAFSNYRETVINVVLMNFCSIMV